MKEWEKNPFKHALTGFFALVMTVSSVYGTNVTVQAPDSQEVELSAEPAGVGNGSEKATAHRTLVLSPEMESVV